MKEYKNHISKKFQNKFRESYDEEMEGNFDANDINFQHIAVNYSIKQGLIDLDQIPDCDFGVLTKRGIEIANLLIDGFTPKYIVKLVNITQSTLKTYIQNIFEKIGIHDQTLLVAAGAKQRAKLGLL